MHMLAVVKRSQNSLSVRSTQFLNHSSSKSPNELPKTLEPKPELKNKSKLISSIFIISRVKKHHQMKNVHPSVFYYK